MLASSEGDMAAAHMSDHDFAPIHVDEIVTPIVIQVRSPVATHLALVWLPTPTLALPRTPTLALPRIPTRSQPRRPYFHPALTLTALSSVSIYLPTYLPTY